MLKEKHLDLIHPDESGERIDFNVKRLHTLLVFTKCDGDPDGELLELVKEMLDTPLPIYTVSTESRAALDELAKACFDLLKVIRVYTKQPGKPADMEAPFTVPIGSTVLNLAETVHKDFAHNLKSARIWGSGKFDGQTVQHDHVLQDGDVIELSI